MICGQFPKNLQTYTTGASSGTGIAYLSRAPEFIPVLMGFVLLDLLFDMYILQIVVLYFFILPSCCLFFFDIRILITPLLSSNSSYSQQRQLRVCMHVWFQSQLFIYLTNSIYINNSINGNDTLSAINIQLFICYTRYTMLYYLLLLVQIRSTPGSWKRM